MPDGTLNQKIITRIKADYYGAFNAISEAIIIVDSAGQIVMANEYAEQLFQYEPDTLAGNAMDVLIPQKYHHSHQQRVAQYSLKPVRRAMKGLELSACRQDKTTIPVEINLSPMKIDDEFFTIAMIIDISQRKKMEEQLREAELLQVKLEQDKELVELKSRFVAMLSHEFRNPLAVINASADILRKYFDRLAPEKREYHANQIHRQIRKIISLVDDVLAVSRSGSSQIVLKPSPTHLESFCENICQQLGLLDDDRFTLHFEPIGEVLIDGKILTHILENLLSNAHKYTPSNGTYELQITQDSQKIIFKVSDTGIGIPSDDIKNLFEPFHRASNVSNISGTGLGLTIVRNYVTLHGGTLEVDSNVSQGTTFVVKIPLERY